MISEKKWFNKFSAFYILTGTMLREVCFFTLCNQSWLCFGITDARLSHKRIKSRLILYATSAVQAAIICFYLTFALRFYHFQLLSAVERDSSWITWWLTSCLCRPSGFVQRLQSLKRLGFNIMIIYIISCLSFCAV